jgi:glucose/arabinose dehydrogenase
MQHRDRTFRFSVLLRLALAVVLATLPLLALPTAPRASAQGAINLPYGFISEIVVEGMNLPTSFALAPDGRIFVAEKAGRVRVIKDGQLLETPFVDLSGEVNDSADRGLMGIAVHPKWPAAPYVYVAYVYDPPEASGKNPSGARVSRVLRLTASADNLDVEQPGSGVVLLGTNSTFAHIGNPDQGDAEPFSCIDEGGAPVRDCIPTEGTAHTIDMLQFGPEGALYVSTGDGIVNSKGNSRALDINSLAGKILRIDAMSGEGLSANPFFDGDAGSNRAKVFALGLRNPFRFTIDPRNGRLILGDVGNEKWEEINIGGPGANFGWPCYEGPYEAATYANCDALRADPGQVTQAVYSYEHTTKPQRGAAIGGDLYLRTAFPALYRGAYFYHDFNGGVINFLTFRGNGTAVNNEFANNAPGIVQMTTAKDGSMYLLSVILGGLYRIRYVPGGNKPPTATADADPLGGAAPLEVKFSSRRSTDPERSIVAYAWDFGDGESSDIANPTHTFAENGVYDVKLTVTDSAGLTHSATVAVAVGSAPPVAEILEPGDGARLRLGEPIVYRGRAADPDDGDLGGDSLQWTALLHHDEHIHYDAYKATGHEGSFIFEDHGDDTWLELCLTATDSQGLQDEECVEIKPQEVTYTIASAPSGLPITYAGSRYTTPFKVTTYINAKRILEAPATARGGLRFDNWSDGESTLEGAVQEIVIADGDRVLTATYVDAAGEAPAAASDADLAEAAVVTPAGDAAPAATPTRAAPAPAPSSRRIAAEIWRGVEGATVEALTGSSAYASGDAATIALDRLALPRDGESQLRRPHPRLSAAAGHRRISLLDRGGRPRRAAPEQRRQPGKRRRRRLHARLDRRRGVREIPGAGHRADHAPGGQPLLLRGALQARRRQG